ACMSDADCDAYDRCIHECNFAVQKDCFTTCFEQHPAGLARWTPIYACAIKHCDVYAASCDASQVDACTRCFYKECEDEHLRLLLDPFGYLLNDCIMQGKINDPAGDQKCYDRYPTAKPLFTAYADFFGPKCAEACK